MEDADQRRRGRPFTATAKDVAKFPPEVRPFVLALRSAVCDRYGVLADFYAAYAAAAGRYALSGKEVSRQLRDGNRFPNGPSEELVERIIDLCAPERREEILALRPKESAGSLGRATREQASPRSDTTQEGLESEGLRPGGAASDVAGPNDGGPGGLGSEGLGSKGPAPDVAGPDVAGSGGVGPDSAGSDGAGPDGVKSDGVGSDGAGPGGVGSGDSESGGATSSGAVRQRGLLIAGVVFLAALVGVVGWLVVPDSSSKAASPGQEPGCAIRRGPLSLVWANRQNSPKPTPSGAVHGIAYEALALGVPASVIVVDGDPMVAMTLSQEPGPRRLEDFLSRAGEVRARVQGADLLTALDKAARAHKPVEGGTIVVVDSGLATTGAVRFDDETSINVDETELADALAAQGQLPNLRGMTVVFLGLGETVAPQERLTPAQRDHVADIWKAIATRAKAACVTSLVQLGETAPTGSLPPVPTVPVPAPVRAVGQSSFDVRFGDALLFEPDTSTFADPERAMAALRPVADHAAAQPGARVHVVGTSANLGSRDSQVALSSARARAVADALISLGVAPSRIDVEGVGSDFPGYVPDVDDEGNVIPGAAEQNRRVLITIG